MAEWIFSKAKKLFECKLEKIFVHCVAFSVVVSYDQLITFLLEKQEQLKRILSFFKLSVLSLQNNRVQLLPLFM